MTSRLEERDDRQAEGCLAGAFRTEHLDDAATGESFATEGQIQAERAGGDAFDIHLGIAAEAHDGALAELLLDLGEGGFQGFGATLVALGWSGNRGN